MYEGMNTLQSTRLVLPSHYCERRAIEDMERKKSVVTNQCTTGTLSVFFIALVSSMLMSMSIQQVSGLSQNSRTTPTRRSVLRTIISSTVPISTLVTATTTTLSPLAAEAKEKMSIADRLDATELTMPPPSRATELNGVGAYSKQCTTSPPATIGRLSSNAYFTCPCTNVL